MTERTTHSDNVLVQALILDTEEGVRRTVSTIVRAAHFDAVRMLRRTLGEETSGEIMLWFADAERMEAPQSAPDTILLPDERILLLFKTTPDNPLNDEIIDVLLSTSARLEHIMAPTRETMGGQIGQEIGFERSSAIIAVDGDRNAFLTAYGIPLDEDLRVIPDSPAERRQRWRGGMQALARDVAAAEASGDRTLQHQLWDGLLWLLSFLQRKK